jgi:hypothetical protein
VSLHVPHQYRNRTHPRMGTGDLAGNNGLFEVPYRAGVTLVVIASDGLDLAPPAQWEHVSVRAMDADGSRVPTWDEMCHVKALFWDAEDCAVQLHPPRSRYVNRHPHVLHLWRSLNTRQPLPPLELV